MAQMIGPPAPGSQFQKALTPPSQSPDPTALQNTMSGQAINAIDPSNQALQPFDENIQKAHDQLNALLSQYPDINYQDKYASILNDIQNRPEPASPTSTPAGALGAFAANMGAPKTAPALLQDQIQRSMMVHDQKQKDLMTMKEALLHGSIQQEVSKGNFKMAIKQSEALDDLQRANADRTRAQNIQQWFAQQKQRSADAMTMLQTKIRTLAAANFHLGEKEQLELLNKGLDYRKMLESQQGLVPGTPRYSDGEIDTLVDQYLEDQSKIYQAVTGKKPSKTGTTATTTSTPVNPLEAAANKRLAAQKAATK